MTDDDMNMIGKLMADMPPEMKNRVAADMSDRLMDAMAGIPVDIVLATTLTLATHGIAASVRSRDVMEQLLEKCFEQIREGSYKLYDDYEHLRNKPERHEDGSEDIRDQGSVNVLSGDSDKATDDGDGS